MSIIENISNSSMRSTGAKESSIHIITPILPSDKAVDLRAFSLITKQMTSRYGKRLENYKQSY